MPIKVRSIRINTLLNIIKTLVVLAFPLITYPYVFRILGVEQMGIYSFTKSIVNYFALIASLGITNYAIREGARIRDDRKKFEEFSSQMFSINLISTFIGYFVVGEALGLFRIDRDTVSCHYLHNTWNGLAELLPGRLCIYYTAYHHGTDHFYCDIIFCCP